MSEEKHVEEKIVERKIEVTGDASSAGTDNPQPAPDTPHNKDERPTEDNVNTQDSQEAVEKTNDENKD